MTFAYIILFNKQICPQNGLKSKQNNRLNTLLSGPRLKIQMKLHKVFDHVNSTPEKTIGSEFSIHVFSSNLYIHLFYPVG